MNLEPIYLSFPCLRGNEKAYVLDCVKSEWVSSGGTYVSRFEQALAGYVNAPGAVACVNGTAALHVCLLLAGVQPGEEVIVPTLTFIAPVNTVRYVNAEPVFMDCDDYLNLDVQKLETFLETECTPADQGVINRATGRRIRAVVPVNVFGSLCDMDRLIVVAAKYRLLVIEDATEALGSRMRAGKIEDRRSKTGGGRSKMEGGRGEREDGRSKIAHRKAEIEDSRSKIAVTGQASTIRDQSPDLRASISDARSPNSNLPSTTLRVAGKHAGTIGDYGCYSFNGNKIITCGGGGMIVARAPELLARARYLTTQAKDDDLHYVHNAVGYNYRLTAIQAAMGLAQLEQLPTFIETKKRRYHQYKEQIECIPGLRLLGVPEYCDSNYWFYSVLIDPREYGIGRDELLKNFEAARIQARPIWKLNHTQKPYLQNQSYQIEKAQQYWERIINIPCSVGLTDEEMGRVVAVLKNRR
jgi:dTDP-4-amino-4,6-dideoxygalactose transaminase